MHSRSRQRVCATWIGRPRLANSSSTWARLRSPAWSCSLWTKISAASWGSYTEADSLPTLPYSPPPAASSTISPDCTSPPTGGTGPPKPRTGGQCPSAPSTNHPPAFSLTGNVTRQIIQHYDNLPRQDESLRNPGVGRRPWRRVRDAQAVGLSQQLQPPRKGGRFDLALRGYRAPRHVRQVYDLAGEGAGEVLRKRSIDSRAAGASGESFS